MIVAEDFSQPLDFCIRALLRDGLPVAPFDRHPDGDHSLRRLGLDIGTWQAWLQATLRAQARLDQAGAALGDEMAATGVTRPERLEALPTARLAARPFLRTPYESCPGSDELRTSLARLWVDDRPRREAAQRRLASPNDIQRRSRGLWQRLDGFRASLSELAIYLIDYPVPAVMVVAPASCLIAPGPDYVAQVVSAAEQLAGRSQA